MESAVSQVEVFHFMWPLFVPVFVPVTVNWQLVVNYHVYGQTPAKSERIIEAPRNCLGFVDTALLEHRTPQSSS